MDNYCIDNMLLIYYQMQSYCIDNRLLIHWDKILISDDKLLHKYN